MGILHITVRSDLLDSFPLVGSETLYRADTVFKDIAVYTGCRKSRLLKPIVLFSPASANEPPSEKGRIGQELSPKRPYDS